MYWQLSRQGVHSLLAAPFYDGDRLLGYLGADNYMLEEDVDSIRVLQTVASFVGARIVNRRLMETVERLATRDELTDLLNRNGVDLAVDERLSAEEDVPFALALMSIDGFKDANHIHGRGLGDVALRTVAQELRRAFPTDAVIGRNGGDEFVVVAFGDAAGEMESRLVELTGTEMTLEHAGEPITMTLSAGYASCPEVADNLHDAYSDANAALRAARDLGGRGCVQYPIREWR